MTRGRPAKRAPQGWRAPVSIDEAALTYTATLEDSAATIVDASNWGAPHQLSLELLQAIRAMVETEGRWQRRRTLNKNAGYVRQFAQWVGRWNDPNIADLPQPQSICEITAAAWSAWTVSLQRPDSETAKRILLQVALVLGISGLLTPEAAERVGARKGGITYGTVEHYSNDEYRALVSAAKRVVRQAHERITSNYADALSIDPTTDSRPTRESVLSGMLIDTYPRSKPMARLIGATNESTWFSTERNKMVSGSKIQKQVARRLLYPDMSEAFAATVLLACLRGLNLSQVETSSVPDRSIDSAGRITQLGTDKPRRGPSRRFSLEVFDDNSDDSDGRWLRRIEEMTEPLRHHLRLSGNPTDQLILGFTAVGTLMTHTPSSIDRARMVWLDGLPVVDFNRIKRTYETRHSRESTQNTEAVHLSVYMSRDPERIAEYQDLAADGIERAYNRAIAEVQLIFVDERSTEAQESEDSTLAACKDPDHEPRSGLPCHDGFLGCLSCPNAIATSRHLPVMRFTLGVLDEVRATLPDAQWSARFRDAHAQLEHVVRNAPVDATHRRVTRSQQALVMLALGLVEGRA